MGRSLAPALPESADHDRDDFGRAAAVCVQAAGILEVLRQASGEAGEVRGAGKARAAVAKVHRAARRRGQESEPGLPESRAGEIDLVFAEANWAGRAGVTKEA